MAKFIVCPLNKLNLNYIGQTENDPVNLDLCFSIRKQDESNGYGNKYPIINFVGCNVKWYFNENQIKLRDKIYEDIINAIKYNYILSE